MIISIVVKKPQKSNVQGRGGTGEVAQTMYTHVNKCKNDKRKEKFALALCPPPHQKNPMFLWDETLIKLETSTKTTTITTKGHR
jgi:hypothetical protein